MSTILKTLKKLEEEKSVLEQNVDLKGLVLHGDDHRLSPQKNGVRKITWIVGLICTGIVLGGVSVIFFKQADPVKKYYSTLPAIKESRSGNSPNLSSLNNTSHQGVPLSNVPEVGDIPRDMELEQEFIEWYPEPAPPERSAESISIPPTEAEDIDSLIAKVKESVQNPNPAGSKHISGRKGHISGLKVKGIIYFGEDSLSNHIFISTPDRSNLKMRIGDSAQNATLESVQSSKAVFSFRDELIEIAIGE